MQSAQALQNSGVKDATTMASTSKLRKTTSVASLNDNKKTSDQTNDYQGSEVHLEERGSITIICDDESGSAQHLDKCIYDSETNTIIYADGTDVNIMNNEKGRTQATVHVFVPFNGTGTDNEPIELENDSENDPEVEEYIKNGSDFSREKHLLGHCAEDETGKLENDVNIHTPLYHVDAKGTDNETQLYENDLGRFMYLTDVSFRKTCFPDIWSSSSDITLLYKKPQKSYSGSYDVRYTSTSLILLNNKLRQEINRLRKSDKLEGNVSRPQVNPERHSRAPTSCSLDFHLRCNESSTPRFEPSSGMRWLKSMTPARFLEKYSVNQKRHRTCVPSREPSVFSLDISPSHSSAELKKEKSNTNRSSAGTPYKTKQKKKDAVSK